jgi:hypothetical protein
MKLLLIILAITFTGCKTTTEKNSTPSENRQQSRDRN